MNAFLPDLEDGGTKLTVGSDTKDVEQHSCVEFTWNFPLDLNEPFLPSFRSYPVERLLSCMVLIGGTRFHSLIKGRGRQVFKCKTAFEIEELPMVCVSTCIHTCQLKSGAQYSVTCRAQGLPKMYYLTIGQETWIAFGTGRY